MTEQRKRFLLDLGERVAWTALQAGLALVAVDQLDLPGWAIVPAGAALATLKGFVASRIGRPDSASTVPGQGTR
jgi:hypothetical protein